MAKNFITERNWKLKWADQNIRINWSPSTRYTRLKSSWIRKSNARRKSRINITNMLQKNRLPLKLEVWQKCVPTRSAFDIYITCSCHVDESMIPPILPYSTFDSVKCRQRSTILCIQRSSAVYDSIGIISRSLLLFSSYSCLLPTFNPISTAKLSNLLTSQGVRVFFVFVKWERLKKQAAKNTSRNEDSKVKVSNKMPNIHRDNAETAKERFTICTEWAFSDEALRRKLTISNTLQRISLLTENAAKNTTCSCRIREDCKKKIRTAERPWKKRRHNDHSRAIGI